MELSSITGHKDLAILKKIYAFESRRLGAEAKIINTKSIPNNVMH